MFSVGICCETHKKLKGQLIFGLKEGSWKVPQNVSPMKYLYKKASLNRTLCVYCVHLLMGNLYWEHMGDHVSSRDQYHCDQGPDKDAGSSAN